MVEKEKVRDEKKTQDAEMDQECHWFRSSDEKMTGFISGITAFDIKRVEYSVINGRAIFEGDIALGTIEQMDQKKGMLDQAPDLHRLPISGRGPAAGDIAHGIGVTGERFRWPSGLVPYETQEALRQRVTDAIRHWQERTNIRFVERTAANSAQYPNFVSFQALDGCWSFVGMQGGQQVISLAAGCGFGAAVHEIGHAVGLWHEQSREDRDRFIRINWANIQAGRQDNFNQHITDGDDIGEYDFGSLMHYGATAFSNNGQPTIEAIGGQAIGQRNGLSAGDIAAVRAMYPNLEPSRSWKGVQFRGTLGAGATQRWFTHSWPSYWYVLWTVVPTAPIQDGPAQVEWKVQVTRQTETLLKYFIEVKNLTGAAVNFEVRYNVLGWHRGAR